MQQLNKIVLRKFLYLSCILMEFCHFGAAQVLQCYTCENCLGPDQLTELQICGGPQIPVVNPIATATTVQATTLPSVVNSTAVGTQPNGTAAPSVDTEEYSYDYSEDEEQVAGQQPRPLQGGQQGTQPRPQQGGQQGVQQGGQQGTQPGGQQGTQPGGQQGATQRPQQPAATQDNNQSEDYEYEEYDSRRRSVSLRRRSHLGRRNIDPICYIAKYRVNGTVITNRGCSTILDQNKYLACQSLYDGRPMEECKLCAANGCNRNEADIQDPWLEDLIISAQSSNHKYTFLIHLNAFILLKYFN